MSSNRLPPITKGFTDESIAKCFRFTFYCDCCAKGRRFPSIPFSEEDKVEDFDSFTPAQKQKYDAEYDYAYERANRDAIGYFVACANCGKYICEDCRTQSVSGETLCTDCVE